MVGFYRVTLGLPGVSAKGVGEAIAIPTLWKIRGNKLR
jgi:hypothetical protein